MQKLTLTVCLLLTVATFVGQADSGEARESWFAPSDNHLEDVARTIELAGKQNKHALIVLGADWCHDSRALATRLEQSPLRELIQEHYETTLVDVGFYEYGFDVLEHFGHPAYYATPTVLIVDPVTGALVDEKARHQWGNAESITMEDSVAYFQEMSQATPEQGVLPDRLLRLYQEIRAWEGEMADRVVTTYGKFGPMVREYKAGSVPPDFRKLWDEFARFRNAIPVHVQELKAKAAEAVAAQASTVELEYPEFPPFSWESSTDP